MNWVRFLILSILPWAALALHAAETVGQRPYELDWAGRTNDHCVPLVDFEDLAGWRVECRGAAARLERTREQQIWGRHVAKLTYRGTNNSPEIRLLPPRSVPISAPFDAVTLWAYGNNWGWAPDPSTPHVGLTALFEDAQGREFPVYLYHVDWTEWYLLHRRLAPDQIERAKQGAKFKGLLITNGKNKDDRVLYFDNLAVFAEQFPPLQFEPRPARGIAMFPGQSAGANTGPGKLPFPTREETILPDNLTKNFKTTVQADGTGFLFIYTGNDGRLVYRLDPRQGTWSDITAAWGPSAAPQTSPARTEKTLWLRPCESGGIYLQTDKGPALPQKIEHLGTRQQGEAVESRWRLSAGGAAAEVTYLYRLWNKSLVIDVLAPGGTVAEVRFGRATGLAQPRLVTLPFYPAEGGRPAVAVSGADTNALFLMGNVDWYRSNGSTMWAANSVSTNGVVYNGGTRYVPLTNGKRNDCFERFFITLSPRFEEVLPVIANPPSPWKHVTGTRVWRAHGASDRKQDAAFWTECHRYGMTQVIVTDHETLWRDGGESFTFRTRAAPGKGGDPGAFDYARLMQDKLGFVYGPYNNFTDFAPVNEFWSLDRVARDPQNQLQHAWMRCYAPKPARAVESCAMLAPQIQEKFHFSTAYCDVHTAVAPWHRVDYDPRVPGAGTFAAVFYSFGEIMLHQKKAWNGPVYSEGNYHSFYMGLTDGNYGQDQSYRPAENPWLVDFDLRRMHDLGCNFGMGNPDMFYASQPQPRATREQRDAWLDRFLAATVAFGHPGFLVYEGGTASALRSYYMLQQLHSRYCLTNAADIRYADATGALLDTSRAGSSGAYKRSQIVAHYADGTVTAANGSRTERMKADAFGRSVDLPPNGYAGWTADGAVEVLSSDPNGHRCDYAVAPAYMYVDGRDQFVRFEKAAGNGIGICRTMPDGKHEVILHGDSECGFAVKAGTATALDKEGKELGLAQLRQARGLTYVLPVKGAFSYVLSGGTSQRAAGILPADQPAAAPRSRDVGGTLACNRERVIPGETVVVTGPTPHTFTVPKTAKPGTRLWQQFEDGWLDFAVVALADTHLSLRSSRREEAQTPLPPAAGNQSLLTSAATGVQEVALSLELTPHVPRLVTAQVTLDGQTQTTELKPEQTARLEFPIAKPDREFIRPLALRIAAGEFSQEHEWVLKGLREPIAVAAVPEKFNSGQCLRGQRETGLDGGSGAIAHPETMECGGVSHRGLFMHPPYMTGIGYAFALYDPVQLPGEPHAAFRCNVGKRAGSDRGDGILFRVAVVTEDGQESMVAEKHWAEYAWTPLEADLSRWAGQTVRLKLIADVGRADDSTGDWACWAGMKFESLRPELALSLDPDVERHRRAPAPYPIAGLTETDLRVAKSGWLRYDGKGLEDPGKWATFAALNGVALGEMAHAGGGEERGQFAERVGVRLTPEALRSLGLRNRFVVKNPNHDSFSLRRFWIDLELRDGRRCSSEISAATFSQPPGWPHAEGITVPFGEDLAAEIWFQLSHTTPDS
jgi:hypothetical protein